MPRNALETVIENFQYDVTHLEHEGNDSKLHLNVNVLFDFIQMLYQKASFHHLTEITAIDYLEYDNAPVNTRFALLYILRHENFVNTLTIKVPLKDIAKGAPSILPLFKGASWLEREIWDQYGIHFEGHPNLRRLLNHHQFIGHPLRRDYPITKAQPCTMTDDLVDQMNERLKEKGLLGKDESCTNEELLNKYMILNLGPSHPASHGTIRTMCALDGETIIAAVSEIGYLHRGFEKSCENHTYNQIIPYTDRLNYLSAITNNVGFVKTAEEMLGVTVPDRAIYIRVILMELSRIIDHLVCLAANLVDMGALTNYWYLFNPKEKVNSLLSKLTGARLTNSYMRVGGMSHDLYDGFEADLEQCLKEVEKGMSDTLILIEHNRIFHDRTQNIASVSAKEALNRSFCGPNLRASGVAYDMRISDPYYYYDSFDFDMVLGSQGDIYDRLMVRFEEIRQSIRIIRQAVPRLPDGPVNVEDHGIILPEKQKVYSSIEGAMNQFKLVFEGVKIPKGEHYSAVEAPNGELGFYIVSDGSGTPYKVKVRAPSLMMMQNLPDLVEGTMIADAVLALGSINIIAGELDR
jgi:NADH-quinone oxidoreductase subunit C/D